MPIVKLEAACLSYGETPLLDHVQLNIEAGNKYFLVGRNGSGKSSLFKVLLGINHLDSGEYLLESNTKVAELKQTLPLNCELSVFEAVAEGLSEIGSLLNLYHELSNNPPLDLEQQEAWLSQLANTEKKIEQSNGWAFHQNIDKTLLQLNLNPKDIVGDLSGGWQRRVELAKAIVSQPQLLLLDEPTNHLDIEAIEWLEAYLAKYTGAVICITHDRQLLRKLAYPILELDRGKLRVWDCPYDVYTERKAEAYEVELKQAKLFDKKLAEEEKWIRQGVKARRTRNEGRVLNLKKLREEHAARLTVDVQTQMSSNQMSQSGKLVVEAINLNHAFGDQVIVKDFHGRIQRGDRIALIGKNGQGKSTFLKLLLGELKPQAGTVRLGTQLDLAYFEQTRSTLEFDKSLIENVAAGRDSIQVNGKDVHIISYLKSFLFSPSRALEKVRNLSGGECNRLLLAKLFSYPNNLLILDEPSNDLDMETLELLENLLLDYAGTLLLVSHDRAFIDNVVTACYLFEGNGKISLYSGGYSQIPAHKLKPIVEQTKQSKGNKKKLDSKQPKTNLSNVLKRIQDLETKQAKLQSLTSESDFYTKAAHYQEKTLSDLKNIESQLNVCYTEWEGMEKD